MWTMTCGNLPTVLTSLFALCAMSASPGARSAVLHVEDIEYDVSSKVHALSMEPGRLETIERKIDPEFGILVDEVAIPEEGTIVKFLPVSGTVISFSRDSSMLRGNATQPLDRKTVHSKAIPMLQALGLELLIDGENMISEEDWIPCKSEIVPLDSEEDVLDSWCLSKSLSYRGIPSVSSFIHVKLDGRSGKPIQLLYLPTMEIEELEPRISSDTAKEVADSLIVRLDWKGMTFDTSRLVIASPNNKFSRKQEEHPKMMLFDQRLAWEVSYSIDKLGHKHHVRIYVDAMNGDVLGG